MGTIENRRRQKLQSHSTNFPISLRRILPGQKYYIPKLDLCVITFLPHILDSSEEERQSYLDRIKEVALKFRGKPFKFLWSQGGDQFEFEEKLGAVGVGYPVVATIFNSKKIYGKLKKSFSEENL